MAVEEVVAEDERGGTRANERATDQERLRYGLRCFAYFVAALVGLGWLMHFGHG